jgi:Zn finger protein HypA/HybF involved in hydrogenase expression
MAKRTKIQSAQIENAEQAAPEVTPEETPEVQVEATKAICMVPNCGREAKIRGLCGRCCTSARMQIKKGKTTWQQLEELRLAKPARTSAFGGEPAVFVKALKAALDAKK